MTTINTDITRAQAPVTVKDRLAQLGARVASLLESYAHARSRRDSIEALEALSDDELARIGLTRDTIVRHVFRDTFYM